MKHNTKIAKKEARKKRRAAERFRRWLDDLRRRQLQAERDRRRRWLLILLLMIFDTKPVQVFFPSVDPVPAPPPSRPTKQKNDDSIFDDRPQFDDELHVLRDYAPRPGEAHLEVYDGLTYEDIVYLRRMYRPYEQAALRPQPIPGMPARYSNEPPHIWTLMDHLREDFLRHDAAAALKTMVRQEIHDWIDACIAEDGGWKAIRRCRARTPEATLMAMPRAAVQWREDLKREAEERKRELGKEKKPDDDDKPII